MPWPGSFGNISSALNSTRRPFGPVLVKRVFIAEDRLGWRVERVKEKNKFILRESEKAVFAGDFALVVSLSSARLSGRQAVCTLPTDEIDR